MLQAKIGDRVKVHYSGFLKDGTVFSSTHEEEPFEFTIGQQGVMPAFAEAVIGMEEGDSKKVVVAPEDAYGHYRDDLVFVVDRSRIPSHITPEVGKILQIRLSDGTATFVTIKEVAESTVTLDGNDPLAGKELTFEIELLEIIRDAQGSA